jgi:NDP-sugar pyrophosphorylase family protein
MKAMVLCAGFGTRLGDLTRELPKPLLRVHEHPIIGYLLSHLSSQGYREVAINLHFRPDLLQDYLGDGSRWNLRVTYSHETTLLGTAGGLRKMAGFFRNVTQFLVHYGDILTDQDFRGMQEFHRQHNALATLLVHPRALSNSIVCLNSDQQITAFLERPTDEQRRGVASPWVNSGVCLCHPSILDQIPADQACDLPRDVFTRLVNTGRLFGYPLSGYRCAIDSPQRLAEAQAALQEGRCRIQPPATNPPSAQRP